MFKIGDNRYNYGMGTSLEEITKNTSTFAVICERISVIFHCCYWDEMADGYVYAAIKSDGTFTATVTDCDMFTIGDLCHEIGINEVSFDECGVSATNKVIEIVPIEVHDIDVNFSKVNG